MDLDTFKQEKNKLSKALEKHSRTMLVDEFKRFFDAVPEVKEVHWTQYTPHFNDGDACVFSRHDFEIAGDVKEQLEKTDYFDPETQYNEETHFDGGYFKDKSAIAKALDKLEKAFNGTEDVFNAAFGDGVEVTCTRKGFTVNDYDHD